MNNWIQDTSEGECIIEIEVKLNKLGRIKYWRTSGADFKCSGDFILNEKLIENMHTLEGFYMAFKDYRLFDFVECNGFTNIDSIMDALYHFHGENFVPDPNDYYMDSKGYTLPGEKLIAYWSAYIHDKLFKEYFLKQIELATLYDNIDSIIIEKFYWNIECNRDFEKYVLQFDGQQLSLFKEDGEHDCFE